MERAEVTIDEFTTFIAEYFSTEKHVGMRMGQAFMNAFFPNESNPTLFFEEDSSAATVYIMTNYMVDEIITELDGEDD